MSVFPRLISGIPNWHFTSGKVDNKTPRLWDAESGELLREWQLPWAPQCVAWNPKHSSLVVVALPNGTCALFNVDAGSHVVTL